MLIRPRNLPMHCFLRLITAALLATSPLLAQSPAPQRPSITGISHVAYYVSDMPKALVFWHDLLGFDLSCDRKKRDSSDTTVAFLKVMAIATAAGGFTAGDTFSTGTSTTTSANTEVFKNGATPFVDGLTGSNQHAGIVFDTVGTFGNNLIVTLEGSVQGYDSGGNPTFTYTAPSGFLLEGATVAPHTYALCPGCLFITAVNGPATSGAIYVVTPGQANNTPITHWSTYPGAEPEGLVFVGNNLSCTLTGPGGVGYDYLRSEESRVG